MISVAEIALQLENYENTDKEKSLKRPVNCHCKDKREDSRGCPILAFRKMVVQRKEKRRNILLSVEDACKRSIYS